MNDDITFDIRRFLGPIRRRLRLVIGTIVLLIGATALILFAVTPQYTAEALVFVDPTNKNLLDPSSQMPASLSVNATVDSEVEIIHSQAVLLAVVRERQLADDPEFGSREGWRQRIASALRLKDSSELPQMEKIRRTIDKLGKRLSVRRLGMTYIISIKVRSETPDKAADLANAIASTYIQAQVSAKINNILAARDVLNSRITLASEAMRAAEGAFEEFITDNLDTVADKTGSADLAALRDSLQSTRQQRDRTFTDLQSLTESINSENWTAVTSSLQSEALRQLDSERRELESKIKAAPQTPATFNLRDELRRVESALQDRAAEAATSLRQEMSGLDTSIEQLRQELRSSVLESNLPTDLLTKVYQLQQNSAVARSQYETLLSRLRDVEAQGDLQIADSRIVSAALAPTEPSFPKTVFLLALAAVVSVFFAFALAFIYENYIGGFVSPEQTASVLGVRHVFAIPWQRATKHDASQTKELADVLVDAPFAAYSEAVRRIWLAIEQYRSASTPARTHPSKAFVVMVTSSAPAEGKTTLAISIARMLALEGRDTLLVDCDLRRPGVHKYLGLDVKLGLQELLLSPLRTTLLDDAAITDAHTSLRILGGRRAGEHFSATILAGRGLPDLITHVSDEVDFIILDTPPIGPVVDGLYLAPHADLIVFSIEWAKTSQRDVKSAFEALKLTTDSPPDTLCVLNKRGIDEFAKPTSYSAYYNENS